jgi:hypothetical protein
MSDRESLGLPQGEVYLHYVYTQILGVYPQHNHERVIGH